MVDYGLQRFVKLFAGFADGEAAADFEDGHWPAGANIYFHGSVIGHVVILRPVDKRRKLRRLSICVHYTTKEDDKRLARLGLCGPIRTVNTSGNLEQCL